MDEIISQIDVAAIQESIRKGIEYGGEFFLRFQAYGITINAIGLATCLLIMILLLAILKPMIKWINNCDCRSCERPMVWAPYVFFWIIVLVLSPFLVNALIKTIFIPEVYLLQYIMN